MAYGFTRRARLMTGGALGVVMTLALAGGVQAQTASQDEQATQVDEIVVTGIRRSIEASISAKANNTSIVEVISSEDIRRSSQPTRDSGTVKHGRSWGIP